jgi:glycosyltransferase involved in cell wall biosynthesis
MAALVAMARFVVLPYRSATQSGVVPLAFAFGVPAIASATGGLVEQVIDGETGLLFAPGDVDALRALLVRAYSMGEADYQRMSDQARALAVREWGWDGLAIRLVRFCGSLVR